MELTIWIAIAFMAGRYTMALEARLANAESQSEAITDAVTSNSHGIAMLHQTKPPGDEMDGHYI